MRTLKTIGALLCLLAVLIAVLNQFMESNLWPLTWAALFILPLRWLHPTWFRVAWILPLSGFLLLLYDAYALHHRIAVKARVEWHLFGGGVSRTYVSPSGRTKVYLADVGFVDPSLVVYVSEGGLFPLMGYVDEHSPYLTFDNLVVGWRDTLFVIGDGLISYAYSEADHKAYTYAEWTHGPVGVHDPPKTLEAFSAYIDSLKPKS